MGFGDEIIASGLARVAARETGKSIAFGDGQRIIWSPQAHQVFENNPRVVRPNPKPDLSDVQWIRFYSGRRGYGKIVNGKWKFADFYCPEGEIFFSEAEREFGNSVRSSGPFVVLEPRVKINGACAGPNKQWPVEKYNKLARVLTGRGFRVVQMVPPGVRGLLDGIEEIRTPNFRSALAALSHAEFYVGPEGGLHHGAAAVGTCAVVIFGGFNSPKSTGYSWHENISVGEPCGTIARCFHCKEVMESISVERVLGSVEEIIRGLKLLVGAAE